MAPVPTRTVARRIPGPRGKAPQRQPSGIWQNLVWATGYDLVAIPVAGGVLLPGGIDQPMAVGPIAMSASTIIVAANARLLGGLRLQRPSIRFKPKPVPA